VSIIGSREVSKMTKVYTIREAIGELDAIRMDAITIAKKRDRELAVLVSELASVMGWLARHVDEFESELFEVDTLDGENAHPGMKRR
jgi:hypothetical protein